MYFKCSTGMGENVMKWLENRMQGDETVKIISGNNKKVKYTKQDFSRETE